jgi:hypothetical protein
MTDDNLEARFRLTTRQLELLAVGLAVVVAFIHMFHPTRGIGRLSLLLWADPGLVLDQPRTVAFVVSGLLLLFGASALALRIATRRLYVAGIGLMTTYVLGYATWHLTGHGGAIPGRETPPEAHTMSLPAEILAHLVGDPIVTLALVTETFLFVVCLTLYFRTS